MKLSIRQLNQAMRDADGESESNIASTLSHPSTFEDREEYCGRGAEAEPSRRSTLRPANAHCSENALLEQEAATARSFGRWLGLAATVGDPASEAARTCSSELQSCFDRRKTVLLKLIDFYSRRGETLNSKKWSDFLQTDESSYTRTAELLVPACLSSTNPFSADFSGFAEISSDRAHLPAEDCAHWGVPGEENPFERRERGSSLPTSTLGAVTTCSPATAVVPSTPSTALITSTSPIPSCFISDVASRPGQVEPRYIDGTVE